MSDLPVTAGMEPLFRDLDARVLWVAVAEAEESSEGIPLLPEGVAGATVTTVKRVHVVVRAADPVAALELARRAAPAMAGESWTVRPALA
jgi:hypothetical protein